MMQRRFNSGAGFALGCVALLLAACTSAEFPPALDAVEMTGPADIDLSQYELTFADEFESIDVSGRRCDSRWIAHTPWNGDFGAAVFADPSRGFPFVTQDGLLRIEARKDAATGRWMAGLLSGYNTCNEGFAQQYGYWEIRTQLPEGDGFWPAFWLIGVDKSRYTAEVDIFEHHSIRPGDFSTTLHVHPAIPEVERVLDYTIKNIDVGILYRGFNTWGVAIDEEEMVFYFNGMEYWRTITRDEFKQPLYILINLAMAAEDNYNAYARTGVHVC